MTWSPSARKSFGLAALAFCPLLFVMAAISTVHSLTTYYMQLAVFSAASCTCLVCGISALLGLRWTTKGPVLLATFGGLYFLGAGALIGLFCLKGFLPRAVLMPLLAALTGVGLLLWARKLGRGHASSQDAA